MFKAEIVKHSAHFCNGSQLITWRLKYPRMIHSEVMTHRAFARNAASSRAVNIKSQMESVRSNPVVPIYWGLNQRGMVAADEHTCPNLCKRRWLNARDAALQHAEWLNELNLHKQIVNRILEPWSWIEVVSTSNRASLNHFLHLRLDSAAEPHIRHLAQLMRKELSVSEPVKLRLSDWHIPFADDEVSSQNLNLKIATGRIARVSYEQLDGTMDNDADIRLHDRLAANGHWSPFEHCAQTSFSSASNGGNLGAGWLQYRKLFKTEFNGGEV